MILADKITDLRKKNGWSQEDLAEKLGVSRQSISKWESAQSMPDMSRILKMSEVFGVSTDYLLKDEMEAVEDRGTAVIQDEDVPDARRVSMEEASSFLAFRDFLSGRIAIGVMMCILSPVLLIALSGLQEGGVVKMAETTAAAVGLIALLALVGGAVAIFVVTGLQEKPYEYIEKELIDTEYGVDGMVRDRREKYRHTYTTQLVTGIVLCVVSAVPLFAAMLIYGDSDTASTVSLAVLLVVVSLGVFMIVRCSTVWDGFHMLLQEEEFTPERKAENARNEHLAGIYWGCAVAIYLAVSFITEAWDKTWIVWPVAGVAYGVVIAVANVLRKKG